MTAIIVHLDATVKSSPHKRFFNILFASLFYPEKEKMGKKDNIKTEKVNQIKMVSYPVDKVNGLVWGENWNDIKDDLGINLAKKGSKNELIGVFSIDLSQLETIDLSNSINQFDKRVYIAAASLYMYGNEWVSLTMIYHAMTGNIHKRPKGDQLTKIKNSIFKMAKIWIHFNNKSEADAYKNRPYFSYDGSLLPMEFISCKFNGKQTKSAIHLLKLPPLLDWALGRKQVTSISTKVLQTPLRQTEENLKIENYLLWQISRKRNQRQKCVLLLSTLYKKTGSDTAKKRSRLKKKLKEYLEFYKSAEVAFIKGYRIDEAEGKIIIDI